MNFPESLVELERTLNSHEEWLLVEDGKSIALRRAEIDLSESRTKILFGYLSDSGFINHKLLDWKSSDEKLCLEVSRGAKEKISIVLVPRAAAAELATVSEIARIEIANRISRLARKELAGSRLVRIALDQENSRFAQITIEESKRSEIAMLADVSGKATPEIFLSTAVLWFSKLQSRKKNRVEAIWLIAPERTAKNLAKLCAVLRQGWRERLKIYSVALQEGENKESFLEIKISTEEKLWSARPKKLSARKFSRPSKTANAIIELAPEEIDLMNSAQGETLRFRGLPFARVRKIFKEEKAWYGVERRKTRLNEETREEFFALVEMLKSYRHFGTPNDRHELFRLAPESWLEAILRRDIQKLDGNLILSPLYTQFRTERDRIDLLALRSDGRLAILELKTSPDREMIFQAVDYWRKIEHQRRTGQLQKLGLFGPREIKDESTLIYLVAPALEFHRDMELMASCVSREIEMYRVTVNKNWREQLKVVERRKFGS